MNEYLEPRSSQYKEIRKRYIPSFWESEYLERMVDDLNLWDVFYGSVCVGIVFALFMWMVIAGH